MHELTQLKKQDRVDEKSLSYWEKTKQLGAKAKILLTNRNEKSCRTRELLQQLNAQRAWTTKPDKLDSKETTWERTWAALELFINRNSDKTESATDQLKELAKEEENWLRKLKIKKAPNQELQQGAARPGSLKM